MSKGVHVAHAKLEANLQDQHIKYVVIAMKADNHSESGIFALFSPVRKVAPWLILPAMIGGAALLANNSSSKFRSRKPRKWMSISSRTTLSTATKPVGT